MEGARWPGGPLLDEVEQPGEPLDGLVGEQGEVGGGPVVEAGRALGCLDACLFKPVPCEVPD